MEARKGISYCSACFQAKPQQIHVDFDAAWDGPTMTDAMGEPVSYAVDELVICEDCLKAAGALIGLAPSDAGEKVIALEQAVLDLNRRATRAEDALKAARRAVEVQPGDETPEPPKRGPGRPRKHPLPA